MLLLVVAVLSVAYAQTIPAVYYRLYFVNRDNTTGLNQVETIDANGGGRAVIYSGFSNLLADSLAFDGTYLYVVTGNDTVVRLSAQIPSTVIDLFTHTGVTCVGLGKADKGTGRTVLYYGVSAATNELWQAELNGTSRSLVTTWPGSGSCMYVIQQQNLVFWTTSDGMVYQYNTTIAPSGNFTTAPPSAPQGNSTGGITSAQNSNLMLYGVGLSGVPAIQSNQLDQLMGQVPGTPALNQWTNFTLANHTFCLITLNGVVVVSTDVGVNLYFSATSTTGVQSLTRQILVNVSSIRGLATNAASSLTASVLLLLFWAAIAAL